MQLENIIIPFVSTLLGVLLGIPVAFWIDRKIGEKRKREKAISVLTTLKEEINHNVALLNQIQTQLPPNNMVYFNLDMNAWRATSIQEFEGTISQGLRNDIFRIYYEYEHMSRKIDTQFNMHYSVARAMQNYAQQRQNIIQAITNHLVTLVSESQDVVNKIQSEIENLEKQTQNSVSSKLSWKPFIAIIFSWILLLVLIKSNTFFSSVFGSKIGSFFIYGFLFSIPLILSKFVEKRSITEKFGLQRTAVLRMLFFTFVALGIMDYFEIFDFGLILFAPLTEELFFRGHMLGFLCRLNYENLNNILIDVWWIIYTSVLFGLSHLLISGYSLPSMFVTIIGGVVFGILYVRFKTILWCFVGHMFYNLSLSLGIPEISFVTLFVIGSTIPIIGLITNGNKVGTSKS